MVQGPIPFFSLCEHHSLPFYGKAYIGYIAHEHILGLSKLTRLVRLFARRFTVQERIGQQLADALQRISALRDAPHPARGGTRRLTASALSASTPGRTSRAGGRQAGPGPGWPAAVRDGMPRCYRAVPPRPRSGAWNSGASRTCFRSGYPGDRRFPLGL